MKRLFFGLEPILPSLDLPQGRLLQEKDRHHTLVFLGNKEANKVIDYLNNFFKNPLLFSPLATAQNLIFLSSVAALEIEFISKKDTLLSLKDKLKVAFDMQDPHPWLPHITLCRAPMDKRHWQEMNIHIPCLFKAFHLYESLGHSTYNILWSSPINPIYKQLPHTADYAFEIYALDYAGLYLHACYAISLEFPSLFSMLQPFNCTCLDEVIDRLNDWIARVDIIKGSPIKAVSHHAKLNHHQGVIIWEMILDV